MRKDLDEPEIGGVSAGAQDPNVTSEVAALPTESSMLATGEFVKVTVTRRIFLNRCRTAWGEQPAVSRVIDVLERSLDTDAGPETEGASDIARRFAAMVHADAGIQSITKGTRTFVDDRIGQLLDPDWKQERYMIGEGMQGEVIGRGSYGTVYKVAIDGLPSGMEAVAKVFDPREEVSRRVADCDKARHRFVHEVAVIHELNGYPTARFISSGDLDGKKPFVLMEYLKGADLGHYVMEAQRRREVLPKAFVYNIAALLFKALHHIHHRRERNAGHSNIVHRDLKPDNIRICADGRVLLMDFGLRKAEGNEVDGLTSQGVAVGTMLYMPPEQMEGRVASAKSDNYAAGLIVHQLLTGRVPHAADQSTQVMHKRLSEGVDVSEYRDDAELAAHMLEILERDPGLRPADAGEAGELFFQRSEFAGRYATYAEFLADETATLPAMPPMYPADSAPEGGEYVQQGGSLVATVPAAMDYWKTKYGGAEPMAHLRQGGLREKPKVGILHRTSTRAAIAATVLLGLTAAAFTLTKSPSKHGDKDTDSALKDKGLPPTPPGSGVEPPVAVTKPPEAPKNKKQKPFEFVEAPDGRSGIVFFPNAGKEVTMRGEPARAEFPAHHGVHFWKKGKDGGKGAHVGSVHYMLPEDYMNVRGNTSLDEMRGEASFLMSGGTLLRHKCVIGGETWERLFPANLGIYILKTPTKTIAFTQPLARTGPLVKNCDEWVPLSEMKKNADYQRFIEGSDLDDRDNIILERGDMQNFLGSDSANMTDTQWKEIFSTPIAKNKTEVTEIKRGMTMAPKN